MASVSTNGTGNGIGIGIGNGSKGYNPLGSLHPAGKETEKGFSGDYNSSHRADLDSSRFAQSYSWMREEADDGGSDTEDEMDIDVNEILEFPRDQNRGQNSSSSSSSRPISGRIDPRTAADAILKSGSTSGTRRLVLMRHSLGRNHLGYFNNYFLLKILSL